MVAVGFGGAAAGDRVEQVEQVAGQGGGDLEPHGVGELAGGEHLLHLAGEVDGVLLLHRDVAVAGDAEAGGGGDALAGEQAAGVACDEVLDQHERVVAGGGDGGGHGDAAAEFLRDRDQHVAGAAAGLVQQAAGDDQLERRQERRLVVVVDRQRREQRQHLVLEVGRAVVGLGRGELVDRQVVDAGGGERGHQPAGEQRVLVLDQAQHPPADRGQLLGGGHARGVAQLAAAALQQDQAADPHLEELVEVGGGDREELQAVERRQVVAQRLVEHPLVELEPRQLAVDERRRHGMRGLGAGWPGHGLEPQAPNPGLEATTF